MKVVIVAKVGVAERVRVLQRVRTILRVVQEFPELVLECEASGDDVGYSVVAIFCKHFGLSDGHCTVLHKDVVVNAVYLKQVSRSRLIRLALWQLSTLFVIHHRDLKSVGMAPSGSSGKPRSPAIDGRLQKHDCLLP
jgi:hypothetical protein